MKKVSITWKRRDRDEDDDAAARSEEYIVETVSTSDGFLHLTEKSVTGRATHISLADVALWTEEDK